MSGIFDGISSAGWKAGWEPGKEICTGYEKEVEAIEQKYSAGSSAGCTVFYGASNFRMWKNMDKDLADFKTQNHGFGGATDVLLMHYAERILIPYEPSIVVVQSGSNDYMGLTGSLEEKAETSIALKARMYDLFLDALPNARILALSALLMPGFAGATELSKLINSRLKDLCGQCSRMSFIDADELTFDGSTYRTELFKSDGIHLNRDGQLALCEGFIRPALKELR